ncbi:MAG: hypothetical protein AABX38_06270 [Candidatus Micrarchaeota archaeon]
MFSIASYLDSVYKTNLASELSPEVQQTKIVKANLDAQFEFKRDKIDTIIADIVNRLTSPKEYVAEVKSKAEFSRQEYIKEKSKEKTEEQDNPLSTYSPKEIATATENKEQVIERAALMVAATNPQLAAEMLRTHSMPKGLKESELREILPHAIAATIEDRKFA